MNKKFKFTVKKSAGFDENSLPPTVQEFIDMGAPQGQRNHAYFKAVCQLRDIDKSEGEVRGIMVSAGMAHGLSEHECNATINSAFSKAKREAPSGSGSRVSTRPMPKRVILKEGMNTPFKRQKVEVSGWDGVRSVDVPKAKSSGFKKMLEACFRPGEIVAVTPNETDPYGEIIGPQGDIQLTYEQWMEKIEKKDGRADKMIGNKHGVFMRINPMGPDGGQGDDDVTAYRHALLEWDEDSNGNPIPKEKQLGMILDSDLPCSAIIDSGGKSIHAWVRVDAESREEYDAAVDSLYAMFPEDCQPDTQCRNPSRLARGAGFRRITPAGDFNQQALLFTNQNLSADLNSLEAELSISQPVDWRKALEFDRNNDPDNLLGVRWLCKGGSALLTAPSGIGKSSLTTQLATGWALGRDDMTFGLQPIRPLKSLVLQAENDDGDISEVIQDLVKAHNLKDEELDQAMENVIFQRIANKSGYKFLEAMEALINKRKPDIVWIDPILNFFGGNLNDQQEAASFFYGEGLSGILQRTGTLCIAIHHTAKPPKERRQHKLMASEASYSGFGSSILTNWAREVIALEELAVKEGPRTFAMHLCKRAKRSRVTPKGSFTLHISHSDGKIAWEPISEETLKERVDGKDEAPQGTNEVEGVISNMPF